MYPTTLAAVGAEIIDGFATCDWHAMDRGWGTILVSQPFPHVVDGDWRYTASTAAKLVDVAHRYSGRSGTYLHIGSPSTYKVALAGLPNVGTHVLFDRNALLHDEAAVVDLSLARHADVALLDPPWYEEETAHFLSQASQHLRPRGLVLLAQPGGLTRPGIPEEREALLATATRLGLQHVATLEGFTRYETPHFEQVTLERTLTMRVPADWRTGDLLVLEMDDGGDGLGQPQVTDIAEDEWEETTLGPVRIKFRETPESATYARLTPSGLCSSVSRRDPLRPSIGIWTSGNRVYGCGDRDVFLRSLVELESLIRDDDLSRSTAHSALLSSGVGNEMADGAALSIVEDVTEHLQYA